MSSSSVFFPQLLSTHIRCFPSSNSNSSLISPASHILPGSHFNLRCLWKIIIIDCSAVAHQPTHAGTPTPNYSERNKNSEIAKRKQEKIDSKYINTHDKNTSPFWQSQRKKRQRCALSVCVNQQFSDIKDRGRNHGCGLEWQTANDLSACVQTRQIFL